jgi:pantothenate kinase-related protein Tda10
VLGWRLEQEHKLRARLDEAGETGARGQSDAEIAVFIRHYERLTRHILAEMPARADVVVQLGEDRAVVGIEGLPRATPLPRGEGGARGGATGG